MIPTERRETNAILLQAKVVEQQQQQRRRRRAEPSQYAAQQPAPSKRLQQSRRAGCRGSAETASGRALTRRRHEERRRAGDYAEGIEAGSVSATGTTTAASAATATAAAAGTTNELSSLTSSVRSSSNVAGMTKSRDHRHRSSSSSSSPSSLSSSSPSSSSSPLLLSSSLSFRGRQPGQECALRWREKMNSMVYILYGFATFFMVFWSVMWFFHVLALIAGRWKLHRKVNQVPSCETPLPGVSIIKPLMGADPNLFSNLETFFQLDYPVYELLFCIEDEQDPVLMLVHKLIDKYPSVDAKLFVGGRVVGVNPKINNMQPAYEASKHELILISDSGIRMKEDTLLDMVNYMTDRVGLVHQMPFTCDREGFAAAYEKIFFGTVQSRMYLAADLLRINCHTGMSALIKKALLEEVGGLKAFGVYLAEDFFYAKSLTDRGWKITVCSQPAMQNSGHCEVYSFQARLRRWAKLRVAMLPTTIVLEPLSECLILGACASWAAGLLFDWDMLLFYLGHVALWFMFDWTLLCVVQNGPLPFSILEFVVGWLLSETTRPYLFVQAVLDPLIQWRSRVYRLKWGGLAEEVKAKVKY